MPNGSGQEYDHSDDHARAELKDLELRMRKLESFHHWIATQIYPDIKARIEKIETRFDALLQTIMPLPDHPGAEQYGPVDIGQRVSNLERITQDQYQRLAKAISGHEEILARIERRFAEELQQQRIDPGLQQQQAEFGPNAGRQYQGNGPAQMWAGDPGALARHDQVEQALRHVQGHPPFTQAGYVDEQSIEAIRAQHPDDGTMSQHQVLDPNRNPVRMPDYIKPQEPESK